MSNEAYFDSKKYTICTQSNFRFMGMNYYEKLLLKPMKARFYIILSSNSVFFEDSLVSTKERKTFSRIAYNKDDS